MNFSCRIVPARVSVRVFVFVYACACVGVSSFAMAACARSITTSEYCVDKV